MGESRPQDAALVLSKLRVELKNGGAIVEGVDLKLAPGEILGLVGESGSGKTTTGLSIFGYTSEGAEIGSIEVEIAGESLRNQRELQRLRGRFVSYVPQNPGTALNPSMRIADAINDMIRVRNARSAAPEAGPAKWLETVGLPSSPEFSRRYPHQLSGGQQQRVCIAAALACEPAVVVLDEPTTGLDVVTQSRILVELARLRDEQQISMIYVTHDLAVVSQIADRIAVMYAGQVVEEGTGEEVLRRPRHPYTRGLLSAIPDHARPRAVRPMPGIAVGVGDRPAGCAFAPRCPQCVDRCGSEMPSLERVSQLHTVRCFEWARTPALEPAPLEKGPGGADLLEAAVLEVNHLRAEHRSHRRSVVAASDVSFRLARGACVALVGESGSGKTTIARAIAGLHPIAGGEILLDGAPLPGLARRRTVEQRRRVQIIFQNPADALNPRHAVKTIVARPARVLCNKSRSEAATEVGRLLDAVRLPAQIAERYPEELSGGERQRVAVARALAASPEVLICDEITSALDVSVQAAVLSVLEDLRHDLGLSLLFISHDLGVVATIADYVLVLEQGLVCEEGPPSQLLSAPAHSYTQRLLAAAPSLTVATEAWVETGSTAAEHEAEELTGIGHEGDHAQPPTVTHDG